MTLFPSAWVPHALKRHWCLPDSLSAGLCVPGRGQVSPWELGLQVGPAEGRTAVPGANRTCHRAGRGHVQA